MSNRSYRLPAPAPVGYKLDAKISVVMPPTAAVTNIIANPSLETNTTGYTAVGGSIARVITKQRRGAYSLQVTPGAGTGDGVFYGTVATVAATPYPWSFDVWAEAGREYLAYWASTAAARVSAAVLIVGRGRWERVQVPYGETATTTRRLYIIKNGSTNVRPFYVDGMLAISGGNDVAEWHYFDGDTRGFVAAQTDFYWNGTAHGSTSTMKAHTRAGGRLIDLARYGLVIQMLSGLGMAPPNNVSLPLALPGGEQYQRTLTPASDFSLTGYVEARNWADLQDKHSALKELLDVTRQPVTQEMLLQYEPLDDCGEAAAEPKEIKCSFAGGLEGVWDNHYRENVNLKFRVHLPIVASLAGTVAAALDVRDQFTSGYIAKRNAQGIWGALQTNGVNLTVNAILPMPDGRYLIGGAFTNAGGVADADFLTYYDPVTDTFSAVNATPLNNEVFALLLLSNGNVLVGGIYTNAGGFANADYLTLLTVSTGAFSALNATPLTGGIPAVFALAQLPDGNVAVGGSFLNAGADANADYLAKLTLSTGAYSAFTAAPLTASVLTLAVLKGGALVAGGEFLNAGGFASNDYLTMLLPSGYSAFVQLTGFTALSSFVKTITPLSNGSFIIGGDFVNVNGDTTWDVLIISIMGPPQSASGPVPLLWSKPFSSIDGNINASTEVQPGVAVVGGFLASVGGVGLFDGMFQFTGSTLLPFDVDLTAPAVNAMRGRPTGELIVGTTGTGTANTSGTTSITNPGSLPVKPVIVIAHPTTATLVAPLYSIRNLTTGKIISFSLSLLIGETVTLDFAQGTITSDLRGNLASTVLPGSNMATFELVPGPNSINIFSSLASGNLPSAYIYFTPAFSSVADPVR